MSHDSDGTEPLDAGPAPYDPASWCTEESTAMLPGESHEDWAARMLATADAHGDYDFVERFEQAVAARMLGGGQPVPEA